MIKIDPDRFSQLRAEIGVLPARAQCTREAVQAAIDSAESISDIKIILTEIIKQIRFDK